jgi:hypothetical protein
LFSFAEEKFGWTRTRADSFLVPLMKRLDTHEVRITRFAFRPGTVF